MVRATGGFIVSSLPGGPCVQIELCLPIHEARGGTLTFSNYRGEAQMVELDPATMRALAEALAEVVPGVPAE